ncbi:MAG: sulfotransferase [Deltaproteobacteria bacterium]|nr:sulfotransferase [Deltaproteobacteria bacterium]
MDLIRKAFFRWRRHGVRSVLRRVWERCFTSERGEWRETSLTERGRGRVVALLAVRNESLFLGRCLEHLFRQGIETCVIDNESTDDTRAIAEGFRGRGVFRIETYPFPGFFDLAGQLVFKEQLAKEIDAEWFIHHDADEIREAPAPFSTLREGILAAGRQGYNAVNFDEFVFLPTDDKESFEGRDYVEEMQYYYFFEPSRLHRVNAWRNNGAPIDLVSSGGHSVKFAGRKIYPTNFILRHYIVLSRAHAVAKYGQERVYSRGEVEERGWHKARQEFKADRLRFPPPAALKRVVPGSWDASQPWRKHTILEGGDRSARWQGPSVAKTALGQAPRQKDDFEIPQETSPSKGFFYAMNELPIVVGGFYRSGTSLLRRLLDAHSAIHCGPEVKFFKNLHGDFFNDPLEHARLFTTLPSLGLGPEEILEIFGGAMIAAHEAAADKAGKRRWADKDPENVLYLEEWRRLLPGGFFFIHVVRHPLDALASLQEVGFWKTVPSPFEERVKLLQRFVQAGVDYAKHYPETSLQIRYEDLVTEPEATLKSLLQRLGLGWEPAILRDFYLPQRMRGLEDPKVSATRGVHDSSLGRWRRDFGRREIAIALRILGDDFQGYPLAEIRPGGNGLFQRLRFFFHGTRG